ncbi:MAG: basic secretory protein-like protein, partial [Candidatus Pacebacteria bacterium]|nr:basic secretory protein-like protein [Candidatus Paceibacterota bacterium]
MVAWIPESCLINIFSPSAFESQTSHSKDNFIKVLTHEISHVFIKEIYEINKPRWLIEGLADYVSGKNLNNILLKEIIDFKE